MQTNQLGHVACPGTFTVATGKLDQSFEQLSLQAIHHHVHHQFPLSMATCVIGDFVILVALDAIFHPGQPSLLAMLPLNERLQPAVGLLADEISEELHELCQTLVVLEEFFKHRSVFVFLCVLAEGIVRVRQKVVNHFARNLSDSLIGCLVVALLHGQALLGCPRFHLQEQCIEEPERPGYMLSEDERPLHQRGKPWPVFAGLRRLDRLRVGEIVDGNCFRLCGSAVEFVQEEHERNRHLFETLAANHRKQPALSVGRKIARSNEQFHSFPFDVLEYVFCRLADHAGRSLEQTFENLDAGLWSVG